MVHTLHKVPVLFTLSGTDYLYQQRKDASRCHAITNLSTHKRADINTTNDFESIHITLLSAEAFPI